MKIDMLPLQTDTLYAGVKLACISKQAAMRARKHVSISSAMYAFVHYWSLAFILWLAFGLLISPVCEAQRFVDVTAGSGITQSANSIISTSWFDFDGDNWVDLYVGKHGTTAADGREPNLWVNQRNGTFSDTLSAWFPNSIRGDMHGSQWIDFDNDGDMDLYQVRGGRRGVGSEANSLFVNEPGLYIDRAVDYGLELPLGRGRDSVWFDFNRDGLLDVLIANDKRKDGLQWSALMEQGPGLFTDVTSELGLEFTDANAWSFRVSDLNADGFEDIVMLQFGNRALTYFSRTADGSFEVQNGFLPSDGHAMDLVIGDFNGDQFNDVYIARARVTASDVRQLDSRTVTASLRYLSAEQGLVFRTLGEVTFHFPNGPISSGDIAPERVYLGSNGMNPLAIPFSVSSTDPDMLGIQPHTTGQGNGLYIGYDVSAEQWEVRLSGPRVSSARVDFFLESTATISNLQSVELTASDEVAVKDILLVFDPVTGQLVDNTAGSGIPARTATTSAVAADFDNDMDLDIYLAQETATAGLPDLLLLNQGDATFLVEDVTATDQPFRPHTLEFARATKVISADYDNDGFVDLFLNGTKFSSSNVGNSGVDSQLLRNQGNSNHWLEIKLVGSQSPRDGIGARVSLTAGGATQVRDCDGGKHFWAQNDSRLHFGLGQQTTVDELLVEWPSGLVETLRGVPADQILTLVEGEANNPPVFKQNPFNKKPDAVVGVPYQQGIGRRATDADGDTLTFSKKWGPAWLAIYPNGALRGTPPASRVGTEGFGVKVEDGNGGSDWARMTIEVVPASSNNLTP